MSPDGVIAKRPIDTPLILAAGGPRALAIANEIADGVMCAGVITPGVRDAYLLSFGTVLREGETFASPRVLDAIGPAIAVIYHGAYQAGGAGAVDQLPGGAAWRAEIERFPEAVRHLYVHEGHIYELTDRDCRHLSPALGATTFTGRRSSCASAPRPTRRRASRRSSTRRSVPTCRASCARCGRRSAERRGPIAPYTEYHPSSSRRALESRARTERNPPCKTNSSSTSTAAGSSRPRRARSR